MKPEPFELFAQYHLGILPDGTARFQNANQIAARYGVPVEQLTAWLKDVQLDAETADGTDYDLPARHGEAQVIALDAGPDATLAFAHKTYDEYRARLGHKKVRTFDDDD